MDSLNHTPDSPHDSGLHAGFALLLSALSWAFTLANLQSILSILLTLTSLVWVLIQIRSRVRRNSSLKEDKARFRCPDCDSD
jgi:hypothetical protein